MIHGPQKVFEVYVWCLDSGDSRHMNGDKSLFNTVSNDGTGDTTSFGEGGKSHVLGKGTVDVFGLLVLNDVLCIEGL